VKEEQHFFALHVGKIKPFVTIAVKYRVTLPLCWSVN